MTKEQRERMVDQALGALSHLMLSGVSIRPHVASEKAGVAYQAIDVLQTALAAREAEVAGPVWQPIETAPKDGTTVLVYDAARCRLTWTTEFEDGEWGWPGPYFQAEPTHWMPLPSPPQPAPDTEACRKAGHGPVACTVCGATFVGLETVRQP
jgi:hypothetical protein